jgi:hypothetical protein
MSTTIPAKHFQALYADTVGKYASAPTPAEINNFADAVIEQVHLSVLDVTPAVAEVSRDALEGFIDLFGQGNLPPEAFATMLLTEWLPKVTRLTSLTAIARHNQEMATGSVSDADAPHLAAAIDLDREARA